MIIKVWYHSKPSEALIPPNSKRSVIIFCHFLQETGSRWCRLTEINLSFAFLPVVIYARQNEEKTRARGSTFLEATQSEYDGSFIFLNHFDTI